MQRIFQRVTHQALLPLIRSWTATKLYMLEVDDLLTDSDSREDTPNTIDLGKVWHAP